MEIQKLISPLIASQFPTFYREEGPNFIAFVEAYFEWLEKQGNVVNHSRSLLEYIDIDSTLQDFIVHFKNEYLNNLPESIVADKKLLVKHILDFYRSKGTEKAYRLLFRMFFNEDIDIYVPGKYLFSTSESTWHVPKYIEVSADIPLEQFVGLKIRSTGNATAVVENYFRKNVGNKIIDVLYLSNVEGEFTYNDQILCDDLPGVNTTNAPIIFGSLSAVSIVNGGAGYKVGDLMDVAGSGALGKVRVVSTTDLNGKVSFTLVDGGYGYSLDAVVSVSGGAGSGATFEIGGITDKQIYVLNTDIIENLKNTNLDLINQGFRLDLSSSSGTFSNNEQLIATANVIHFDVDYVVGSEGSIANGAVLSNTGLGISNLYVYNSDRSVLYITGADSDIENANIQNGIVLTDGTATVYLNSAFPKYTVTSNAYVDGSLSNTSVLTVYNPTDPIGYIVPGTTVTGSVSGQTAIVDTVTRLTDWGSFVATTDPQNLDMKINQAFNNVIKEIGRITFLNGVNPGAGYTSNPSVSIIEPLIYDLRIPDTNGKYWGNSAVVTAKAGVASGIVTGISIVDSGYGYVNDEELNLVSANNVTIVTGTSILKLTGKNEGSWRDNKSFLSDTNYLQDSYYYQHYSYEILATRMLSTYESFVKNLVHPAGLIMFGKYMIKSEIMDGYSRPVSFDLGLQYSTRPFIVNDIVTTVDSTQIRVDKCDVYI